MSATSSTWTFLSNHAHVMICLAQDPSLRMRDIAERVGITERAVQRIITELASGGYLEITKDGRRNCYTLHPERELRHPVESGVTVEQLVALVQSPEA